MGSGCYRLVQDQARTWQIAWRQRHLVKVDWPQNSSIVDQHVDSIRVLLMDCINELLYLPLVCQVAQQHLVLATP